MCNMLVQRRWLYKMFLPQVTFINHNLSRTCLEFTRICNVRLFIISQNLLQVALVQNSHLKAFCLMTSFFNMTSKFILGRSQRCFHNFHIEKSRLFFVSVWNLLWDCSKEFEAKRLVQSWHLQGLPPVWIDLRFISFELLKHRVIKVIIQHWECSSANVIQTDLILQTWGLIYEYFTWLQSLPNFRNVLMQKSHWNLRLAINEIQFSQCFATFLPFLSFQTNCLLWFYLHEFPDKLEFWKSFQNFHIGVATFWPSVILPWGSRQIVILKVFPQESHWCCDSLAFCDSIIKFFQANWKFESLHKCHIGVVTFWPSLMLPSWGSRQIVILKVFLQESHWCCDLLWFYHHGFSG